MKCLIHKMQSPKLYYLEISNIKITVNAVLAQDSFMNEYVVYVNINHAIPVEEVHIEVLELKLLTLPMSSLIQSLCKIERLQTNGNPNC